MTSVCRSMFCLLYNVNQSEFTKCNRFQHYVFNDTKPVWCYVCMLQDHRSCVSLSPPLCSSYLPLAKMYPWQHIVFFNIYVIILISCFIVYYKEVFSGNKSLIRNCLLKKYISKQASNCCKYWTLNINYFIKKYKYPMYWESDMTSVKLIFLTIYFMISYWFKFHKHFY